MKNKILTFLKNFESQYISGEEICKSLGVSRTAVWKHIQSLKEEGYIIESQPRKGYCLMETPDRLYPEEVKRGLLTDTIGRDIRYFERVDSTNNIAKDLARQGAAEGTVVVAEEQLGGRGRLGRSWCSPYGKGVWMSVVLRPVVRPEVASQITILTAVAVARAVRSVCSIVPGIKWPNDLYMAGKKLCGILTEMSAEPDRVNYVVVGIGINTSSLGDSAPPEIRNKVTSLADGTGKGVSRIILMQEILRELEICYQSWQVKGFQHILVEWKELCQSLHRSVTVVTLNGTFSGWAEDIDDSGALLLRLSDGRIKKFISGDVCN
ncbi:biotin--[acetyl-CoA-carboxylase] ligase [Desulfolucanica intricata]|uniref:biotin--[acetyl-CoA-carboxylase] ligase n=1 Tax=Desulfolucanica intricata TaxID=1285191 RepID=UPI000833E1E0|nr:biotin--[acetyl-CoA-carboxylase] ligase [Desulfolucanica intricata]